MHSLTWSGCVSTKNASSPFSGTPSASSTTSTTPARHARAPSTPKKTANPSGLANKAGDVGRSGRDRTLTRHGAVAIGSSPPPPGWRLIQPPAGVTGAHAVAARPRDEAAEQKRQELPPAHSRPYLSVYLRAATSPPKDKAWGRACPDSPADETMQRN